MWIDFNGTFFKAEDVMYIDKNYTSYYGENVYTLTIKTTHIEITKTYGSTSRNSKGYTEREEDYKTLCKKLKEFDIRKEKNNG